MARHAKRKLIVHVGPPKTGSASIQWMLHHLSPSLEQLDVHVVAAESLRGDHRRLTGMGTGPGTVEDRWRAVHDEVSRCAASRFVMSSEFFSLPGNRSEAVERFVQLRDTANLDMEIVACVRPQWQWLESSWCERIKDGTASPPFAQWVEEMLDDHRLDYARVLDPWKEAVGQVTVVRLERSRLPDGLLPRFLHVLGVDDPRIVAAAARLPRLNSRLGAKLLEVRRLINVALRRQGLDDRQRALAAARLGGLARLLPGDRPFAGLTHEEIRRIGCRCAARNARFARDYGIDGGGALFRDPPTDGYARPERASWDDLGSEEKRAVTAFMRRRFGLELPAGARVRRSMRQQGDGATLDEVQVAIRPPARKTLRQWTRAVVTSGVELLGGVRQTRLSLRGLLILRWLRWRVRSLRRRARGALTAGS